MDRVQTDHVMGVSQHRRSLSLGFIYTFLQQYDNIPYSVLGRTHTRTPLNLAGSSAAGEELFCMDCMPAILRATLPEIRPSFARLYVSRARMDYDQSMPHSSVLGQKFHPLVARCTTNVSLSPRQCYLDPVPQFIQILTCLQRLQ